MPQSSAKGKGDNYDALVERARKIALMLSDLDYTDQVCVINFTNGILEHHSMLEEDSGEEWKEQTVP